MSWTCEASTSWYADHAGKPTVVLCGKPAKLYGWVALCGDHAHLARKPKERP